MIATELAGQIIRLPVQEMSVVHRGDLLVELQSDDLQESRDEALARIAEADADIRFFEQEIKRTDQLLARAPPAWSSSKAMSEALKPHLLTGGRRSLKSAASKYSSPRCASPLRSMA